MFWFWDSTYVLVILGVLICAAASLNVGRVFNRFSEISNKKGMTAEECAAFILNGAGIYDVKIERIRGNLSDHYSPKEKVLRLSDSVYGTASISAIGVAAHECGHAIQHRNGYFPLKIRSFVVPVASIGSKLSWPLILIGLIIGNIGLARVGVVLFGLVVVFQLITLPVEFNASRRALKILGEKNLLDKVELNGAAKVLKAAAMTYVASLFSSILQLLRLFILTRGNKRR